MAATRVLTVKDVTDAMSNAIEIDGDKLRKSFNATVQFNIDGNEYYYDMRSDNNKKKDNDDVSPPDLIIITSDIVLQDLMQKKISPQQAFMQGKIKMKGKMALAMKLQNLLDATRKQLIPPTISKL